MKEAGQFIAALGAAGFLAALFFMPTSIEAPPGTGDVVNIGLQQRQMLVAMGCLAVFLAGAMMATAGAVLGRVGVAAPSDIPADQEAETMERYGITRDPAGYRFGSFAYPKLSQAVEQAQRVK